MGATSTPEESAPAYEDVFHDHPAFQHPPSGSVMAYRVVPQTDNVDLPTHSHNHSVPNTLNPNDNVSYPNTVEPAISTQHVHCEACDKQLEARERRANERHCCKLVAATFMVLFVSLMLLGIVITANVTGKHRRRDRMF